MGEYLIKTIESLMENFDSHTFNVSLVVYVGEENIELVRNKSLKIFDSFRHRTSFHMLQVIIVLK